MNLYEILVPALENLSVSIEIHKEWDAKVRKIAGGLTIMNPVKGQWVFNDMTFIERMIPVRIMCTESQIEEIAKMTQDHYIQERVMYYKLSNEVYIKDLRC